MRVRTILVTAFVAAVMSSFGAYSATEDKASNASEKCTSEMKGASEMKCMSDVKGMSDMKGKEEMMPNMSTGPSANGKPKKLTAAQDRTKHFHPRDGK